MAEGKPQNQRRRSYNNTDRFGRLWLVVIELASGDPCQILPAGWADPLNTPLKFLRVPADSPRSVQILFRSWVAELKRMHREWGQQLDEIGRRLYDTQYDEAKPPTRRMLEAAGPKPMDVKLVERAAHGDRTLLGFEALKPKDARALGWDPRRLAEQKALAEELGEQFDTQAGVTMHSPGIPGERKGGITVPAAAREEEEEI